MLPLKLFCDDTEIRNPRLVNHWRKFVFQCMFLPQSPPPHRRHPKKHFPLDIQLNNVACWHCKIVHEKYLRRGDVKSLVESQIEHSNNR
jgi:hypothetical protein